MSIENPTEYFIKALTESQNRLYGYIFSLVGEHHAASDILQECNLVLWRKFGEFRPESDFIPWAFAIARFQVLAHLRDRKRSDARFVSPEIVELLHDELLGISFFIPSAPFPPKARGRRGFVARPARIVRLTEGPKHFAECDIVFQHHILAGTGRRSI